MTANQINYLDVKEKARHNQASESVSLANLQEDVRSHKANESYNLANLQETKRHNTNDELIKQVTNSINQARVDNDRIKIRQDYDIATRNLQQLSKNLDEQVRHNQNVEGISRIKNQTDRMSALVKSAELELRSKQFNHQKVIDYLSQATDIYKAISPNLEDAKQAAGYTMLY